MIPSRTQIVAAWPEQFGTDPPGGGGGDGVFDEGGVFDAGGSILGLSAVDPSRTKVATEVTPAESMRNSM
jgi:hypothetical protein